MQQTIAILPSSFDNQTSIKTILGTDIRRFKWGPRQSFLELVNHIATIYKIPGGASEISAKYEDDENEEITLASDEDLREAIRLSSKKILKIHVHNTKDQRGMNSRYSEDSKVGQKRKRRNWCPPADKMKVLEEFGFDDAKLNERALKKLYHDDTDFNKVIQFLCDRKQTRLKKEQKKNKCLERKAYKKFNRRDRRRNASSYEDAADQGTGRRKRCKSIANALYVPPTAAESWEGVTHVLIDGDDLIPTVDILRRTAYQRKDFATTQRLASLIVKKFCSFHTNLQSVVLSFNKLHQHGSSSTSKDDGQRTTAFAAKPEAPEEDHMELSITASKNTPFTLWEGKYYEKLDEERAKRTLYVTSKFRQFLADEHANKTRLMHPISWYKYVADLVGGESGLDLQAMLDEQAIVTEMPKLVDDPMSDIEERVRNGMYLEASQ